MTFVDKIEFEKLSFFTRTIWSRWTNFRFEYVR